MRAKASPKAARGSRQSAHEFERANRLAMANWSAPVGAKVEVTKDDGTKVETVTESMPWVVGGGAALILLKGIVGGYSLVRVRVLPTAEQIAAPAPDGTLSLFGRAAKGV